MSEGELYERIHELEDEVSRLDIKASNAEYDLREALERNESLETDLKNSEREIQLLNNQIDDLNGRIQDLEYELKYKDT